MRRVFLISATLFACGTEPGTEPVVPEPETSSLACSARPRTCAEIADSFAESAAGVAVECDEAAMIFTVRSSGVPDYESNQTTPNDIRDQMWMIAFPLHPSCAETKGDVIASRGPIGFMINGVPFYGPQDARGADAVINEGVTFDDCEGHADPSCSYHYHDEPRCVFGEGTPTSSRSEDDGHPARIGYALDGFAIYASDTRGAIELDECNGHADEARGYHYHATSTFPYLMGCYSGRHRAEVMRVPACRR